MRAPPFFVVWSEDADGPVDKTDDHYRAERSAEMCAASAPGKSFYVLAPMVRVRKVEIERERFEIDERPF